MVKYKYNMFYDVSKSDRFGNSNAYLYIRGVSGRRAVYKSPIGDYVIINRQKHYLKNMKSTWEK